MYLRVKQGIFHPEKPITLKNMKSTKFLIVSALALGSLTFNSCKKNTVTVTSSVYITADIDGTATTFNTNATAVTATVSGQTATNIQGTAKDGTTLIIAINGLPVSGKTYSDAATSADDQALFLYTPSGANADSYLNDDDNSATLPTLTISAITSTTLSGTFSGLVEGGIPIGNSNTLPTKSITNGKFSLGYIK
jgi:hypothetical protein